MALVVDYMRNNSSEINPLYYSGHDDWSTPCMDHMNNNDYARNSDKVHSDTLCTRGRRKRTTFSKAQLWELERAFSITHYPGVNMKEFIASLTGLPESKIQVWFQNRRARYFKSKKPTRERAISLSDYSVPQFSYMSSTNTTPSTSPALPLPPLCSPDALCKTPSPSSPAPPSWSKLSTLPGSQAMSLPAPTSPIPADCFPDRLVFQGYNHTLDFIANEALPKNTAFGIGTWNVSEDFESFFGDAQQEYLPEGSRCGTAELVVSMQSAVPADRGRQQTEVLDEYSELYNQDLSNFNLSELDVSTALIDYILG